MQQEVTLGIRWQAVYFKRQDHNTTIWPPRSARGNVHAWRSTGSRLGFEWRGRNCCTRCRVMNARKSTTNLIHSSPNVSRSLVSAWSRSQPACLQWRWAWSGHCRFCKSDSTSDWGRNWKMFLYRRSGCWIRFVA